MKTTVRFLEKEIERLKRLKILKKQIREHINTHGGMRHDATLLQSIPGVGELTAWEILAELPDVAQFDSAQAIRLKPWPLMRA